MSLLFKNNATGRLKANTTAATTLITLDTGEGARFPQPAAGDWFQVTLEDRREGKVEICRCTSRSADNLTVVRAQEGTAAQSFLAGAIVSNRFTAGTLTDILNAVAWDKPTTDDRFINADGDAMRGPLTVLAPLTAMEPTTKQYVDAKPGFPDAPNDANMYGRQANAWIVAVRASDYTDAAVLAKVKNVDGTGSGLDADLLDGQSSAYYATAAGLTAVSDQTATNTSNIATLTTGLSTKANINSPALTGIPTAPTAGPGTNSQQLATTEFVMASIVTSGGFPEAPNDGGIYGRQSLGWRNISTDLSGKVAKAGDTMTGKLITALPTTAGVGFSLGGGNQAPNGPNIKKGDFWQQDTSLFFAPSDGAQSLLMDTAGNQSITGVKTFFAKPYFWNLSGLAAITINPRTDATHPATLSNGDVWINTTGMFYQHAGVAKQIDLPFPEAPNDTRPYARKSLGWYDLTTDLAAKAPLASPALTGTPTAPTPPAGDNDQSIATTAFVQTAVASGVPPGAVMHFAMAAAPTGWLKANGTPVSRTTYAALFAAIGTTFGVGDNVTTFNLPDLRGEFVRGFDDGRAVDSGRVFGSAQAHGIATHDHTFSGTSNGRSAVHQHSVTGTTAAETTEHTHSFSDASSATGGVSANHTHTFSDASSATGTGSANHVHSGQVSPAGGFGFGSGNAGTAGAMGASGAAHTHTVATSGTTGGNSVTHTHTVAVSGATGGRSAAHTHTFTASVGNETADHTHSYGGTTSANAGAIAETRPRNIALLACIKT